MVGLGLTPSPPDACALVWQKPMQQPPLMIRVALWKKNLCYLRPQRPMMFLMRVWVRWPRVMDLTQVMRTRQTTAIWMKTVFPYLCLRAVPERALKHLRPLVQRHLADDVADHIRTFVGRLPLEILLDRAARVVILDDAARGDWAKQPIKLEPDTADPQKATAEAEAFASEGHTVVSKASVAARKGKGPAEDLEVLAKLAVASGAIPSDFARPSLG